MGKLIKSDNRVTYRRAHPYATRSNKTRKLRTPGGRLVVQYVRKNTAGVHAPKDRGHQKLQGVSSVRPFHLSRLSKNQKTVSRAYGGVLTSDQVQERIVRAFLVEEQREVKKFFLEKAKKQKQKLREKARREKKAAKSGAGKGGKRAGKR